MTSQQLVAAVASVGLLAITGIAGAADYTVTNIGPALPADNTATAGNNVNASGQVVGTYTTGTGAGTNVAPFIYANGVATVLADTYGSPTGLNASGAISLNRGGLYHPGLGIIAIPAAAGAVGIVSATGINDAGLVVGRETFDYTSPVTGSTYPVTRPYVYNPATGVTTDLGSTALGDRGDYPSSAEAISNTGHIVGTMGSMPAGATYSTASAFLATPNGSGYTFVDVGAAVRAAIPGSNSNNATGVNDIDSVIGTYNTNSSQAAFAYINGTAIPLGNFGSNSAYPITTPNGINNSNVVVGTGTFFQDANFVRTDHAFIWKNGTFSDLNSLITTGSGFTLTSATDINNAGQITGYGDYNGKRTAFLLNLIGPLYYNGNLGGGLTNAVGAATNFSSDLAGTAISSALPTGTNDVIFASTNATNLNTTLASSLAVNSLAFGSGANTTSAVTIGGAGTFTINAAGTNTVAAGVGIVVKSGSAASTINANVALGASQSWTNNSANAFTVGGNVALGASTLILAGTGTQTINGVISGSGGITNTASGTVTLSGANTYTGATVMNNATGKLRIATPARAAALGGAGTDIARGTVQFDYVAGASPLAAIRSLLAASYASNGFNNASVLRSSTANAARGLGYTDTGTAVIVKATLYGDSTLDGTVDFNDFLVLQNNFGSTGTTFAQGNFNYDNVTDFNDFLALQNNFGQSLGGMAVAFTGDQVAAMRTWAATVPEPTAFASVVLLAASALRRRRA